jgi:excisionase family DNA binding protein
MLAEAAREHRVVTAREEDVPAIKQVDALLERLKSARSQSKAQGIEPRPRARLVGANGEELEVPGPIYDLLQQIVPYLMRGDAIAVVPYHKELTTQEAADFLNMSRQYVVTLLERGEIPFSKTGTHRRVRFRDVLDYRDRRYQERTNALRDLTRLAEAYGEYD